MTQLRLVMSQLKEINIMAANHKLTSLISGRTISECSTADGKLTISFEDGSHMTVKTAEDNDDASDGTIAKVRQADTDLYLDMDDGYTWEIQMAEASSSVMVRDANNVMEYAD